MTCYLKDSNHPCLLCFLYNPCFESIALTSWIKAAGLKNFCGIPVISKRAGKVFLSIKGDGSSALPFSINLPLTWNWPQIGTGLRRLIPVKEKCKPCQLPILVQPPPEFCLMTNLVWQKYAKGFFHNYILSQQQTLNVSFGSLINFVSRTSLFLHWPKRVPCSIKLFSCFYHLFLLRYVHLNRPAFALMSGGVN